MKRYSKLLNIPIILLIISVSKTLSQDSTKIILLSRDIGPVVSLDEKKEYNILPQIQNNFVNAIYYFSADSFYCCKIKLKEKGLIKDTIIILNYYSLRNTVRRVQLLERSKTVDLNDMDKKFEFIYADGEKVEKIIKMSKPQTSNEQTAQYRPEIPDLDTLKMKKQYNSSKSKIYIPLKESDVNYSKFIRNNFYFGIAFGISWTNPNYSGLTKIFNLLEESIPDPGYSLPKTNFQFKTSPVVHLSSCLVFSERSLLELIYLFDLHGGSTKTVNFSGVMISGGYTLPIIKDINLLFSLGYIGTEFIATRKYNQVVSDGGSALEKITLIGTSKGLNLTMGVNLIISKFFAIKIFGGYNFFPDVKLESPRYNYNIGSLTGVDPDGFEFGISFYGFNN